jgi:oligosaccharide repeat unit polymerase
MNNRRVIFIMSFLGNISNKLGDLDFFSPYIVVLITLLYVILAAVGYQYHIRNLQWPATITYLFILWGVLFYIFGLILPHFVNRNNRYILSRSNLKRNLSWFHKLKFLLDERVLIILVVVALVLQGVNLILLGGIPILSGYLKFKATTDLWRISYIIFLPALNLLLAKYSRKWYYILFVIGLILFAVNGYRTTTIAILLSVLITTYYVMRLKSKYVFLFIGLTAVIFIILGYVAVKSIQWQTWVLNPLELVFYRAGFTMMVLDKITHLPGFTGGELFYQALTGGHPRVTVGQVYLPEFYQAGKGPTTSITSTIFGPAISDFGALGLAVQMFLLGIILRVMHSAQKILKGALTAFYAIMLAHTLIWVETGATDSMVWFFYVLGIIGLLIAFKLYLKDVKGSNVEKEIN